MNKTMLFPASLITIIIILSSVLAFLYVTTPQTSRQLELNTFSSYDELKNFLETSTVTDTYDIAPGFRSESGDFTAQSLDSNSLGESDAKYYAGTSDYSQTNIQVAGVDEADIVKTDGEYIYLVSNGNITILRAYPAEEAQVLSRINLNGTIMGIFVNGNKLVVFENEQIFYLFYGFSSMNEIAVAPQVAVDSEMPNDYCFVKPVTYEPPTTTIRVYDISDRANPTLTRDFSIDGTYIDSRMIGDYVYVVTSQSTFFIEKDVALPRTRSDNETTVIAANEIQYYNGSDYSYSFTTIVAVNVMNDAQEPTHKTILLGSSTNIYVSQNNIYLTLPNYSLRNGMMKTVIQRVQINNQSITFQAKGAVSGYVLNQFSMDEHNGYFRVATTSWTNGDTTNSLLVLNMDLKVVGKLEGLAEGERIYSARFMGDRCYLVTFRQVDPFFVIDLANVTEPKVLGYLKIPGFSGYLHPYDENHVIGIGKEDNNVKLSLFDVTDVTEPTETAKYIVDASYSDSPVLSDPKAFLFSNQKQLLAIPVAATNYEHGNYSYWQGAYIFDASLEKGLTFRGEITHQSGANQYNYQLQVNRILYIDDVLYTISYSKVKMNNLDTLAEINTIAIS